MNWVAPIKDKESLEKFLEELRIIDEKYYILFRIGLGTGMLLQDILKLKVKDVKGKTFMEVFIGSRKVRRHFIFPKAFQEKIEAFTQGRNPEEALFLGGRHGGALSREQVYRVFKEAGNRVGLTAVGAQTMRKTFAWNYYKESGDIYYIQNLLNHASSTITYQYIGESRIRLEKGKNLTDKENSKRRSQLLRNDGGRQRIEKIKNFLNTVERNLGNPEKQDSYFGKAECLLSGIESLMKEFKKSVRKK